MEFDFNVARTLGLSGSSGVVCVPADKITAASTSTDPRRKLAPNDPCNLRKQLCEVVEAMGHASMLAQGLRTPNLLKLSGCPDQRVYFAVRDSTKVVGLLKIGVKKLFIQTPTVSTSIYQRSSDTGQVAEISPTSVLDFYVHESCQRQGWGKKLFEYFLWSEKKSPARLSYDRPSSKLLKFLEKHYALRQYTPQTNNFVVFHKYFEKSSDFHDKLIPKQCPDVFSSAKEKHTKNGGQRGSAGAKADDGDEVGSATPTTSTDGDFEGPSSSSSRFGHGAVGSKGTKSGAVGGSSIAEKVVAQSSGVGNLLKTHHQPAGAGAGGGFVGGKDHPLRAPARTVYGSDYDSGAAGVAPGKLLQATGDGAPAATSTSKRTSDNMLSQQRRFNQLIESNLKTHNSSRTIL
eukprot:g14061.t1